MELFLFLFLIVALSEFSLQQISPINDRRYYYQHGDNFSFNLKDFSQLSMFYQNFKRMGDLVVNKNQVTLAPKVNNTYGLFYTTHVSFEFVI